jgi:hypothetical protein
MRFVPAALASALLAVVVATKPLTPVPRGLALGCVAGAWVFAALFRRADVRAHASVVAAIAGVTAAGQVAAGPIYGAASTVFLLGSLVSMRAARRAPLRAQQAAPTFLAGPLAVIFGTAALLAASLVVGLPRLGARIERHFSALFGLDGEAATAFSTTMVLGSTRGMLQSDAIVMRIDGERPEYLRGAVYDRYDGHFWRMSTPREREDLPAHPRASEATTRITLVRGTPNGPDMRWFLPPGACDLGVPSGHLEVDAFGVARRAKAEEPAMITMRTSGCTTPGPAVAGPSVADLDLRDLRARIHPIAVEWTSSRSSSPSPSPHEQLDAIKRQLGRFEYSLAVERDPGKDPIVDFLTVHRAGHCEMFASAMVLLARSLGIPARVVGGYRVSEVNELTGRAIVRDRNAHAWVEAWIDGAWHGYDPTPMSESFRRPPSTLDNVGDLLSSAIDRAGAAISSWTMFGVGRFFGVTTAVLLGIRWLGVRLRERRQRRDDRQSARPPLPCFDALSAALAGAGYERAASEPIERFAERLVASDAPWAEAATRALLAYAGLRYGGVGDEATIVRDVDLAAREVRARR